ncbi:MAG: HlyC/CorC family transporter [Candidatus Riflebacteria bacterium]|nr:HlyC/CorC family transporter [Candidatus Riflebacteria bacterium]
MPGADHVALDLSIEVALSLAFVLILLNGFFVGAEFALVKIRGSRVEEMIKSGRRGALAVKEVLGRLNESLSAAQLGITLASLALGWLGEPAFAALLRPIFGAGDWLPPGVVHSLSIGFAFALLTFLHIVIGEQAPKSLALEKPELCALVVARPMIWFYRLSYPAIWLLNNASLATLRLFGITPRGGEEAAHSEEELRFLLAESARSGVLSTGEKDLLDKVFRFSDRTARQILVPAAEVVFLSLSRPLEENLARAKAEGYTRYPLAEDGLDSVLGMLHIRDLLGREKEFKSSRDLVKVRRDILVVPETVNAHKLLNLFRKKHLHMAIVVDEFGVTGGLVTLEDVLEELVGEIQDEFDPDQSPHLRSVGPDEWEVDGTFLLDDLKERLGVELDDPDNVTLGGHVQRILGRLAEAGDQVRVGPLQVSVDEVKQHRPGRIRIKRVDRAPAVRREG